ncbi:hypothetical protein M0805_007113 [Coniferiporia weirii]|nr:hypothetical protein M0805_007113 [Coniferiporia weirii]
MGDNLASLVRLFLLVIASAAHHVACTAPPEAKKMASAVLDGKAKECQINGDQTTGQVGQLGNHGILIQEGVSHDNAGARIVRLGLGSLSVSKYTMWAVTSIEGASRILSILPVSELSATLLSVLLPNFDSAGIADASYLCLTSPPSPSFVASVFCTIVGWRIRRACFDALGRHFTFTHTTLSEHLLVTSGPYAVVRHPGYVGMFLCRIGGLGLLLSTGSWTRTIVAMSRTLVAQNPGIHDSYCDALVYGVKLLIGAYAAHAVLEQAALIARAPHEDKTLRDRFRAEWDEYRNKVPWMFIPHII